MKKIKSINWKKIRKQMKRDWILYLLLLPTVLWYAVFCYAPMAGITLSFRDFRFDMGLWKSPGWDLVIFKKCFLKLIFG